MTHHMVVAKFSPGWKERVYAHFGQHGRMLPDGLPYLDSWRVQGCNLCYHFMQTADFSLFKVWQSNRDKIGRGELSKYSSWKIITSGQRRHQA